jgi:eukaryotic-like serine/threonine-protein kinase
VRALARDPRVLLRNRLLALGAAALVGGAFAIGRAAADEAPSCDGGRAAIASVWGPTQRRAVVDRLAAGADPYGRGVAARIGAQLDRYRDRWASGHRDACLDHARGEQSAALLDARMACLARGKTALGATINVLASATGDALPGAVVAAGDLPELTRCSDPSAVIARVSPPAAAIANQVASVDADLERAQVMLLAARPEAREAAVASVARARQLNYPPLLARALLVLGRVAMRSPRVGDALAPLSEATTLALGAGDDALAVEAYARRAWVDAIEEETDFARATAGLPLVEAIASRLQPPARFARALLYNNLGSIELARDRPAAARVAFERALGEAREVTGPGSIELIRVRWNLALVVEPARRQALLAEATREFTRALGDDHPLTLDVRITTALWATDPREARSLLEPTCATYTRLHPTYVDQFDACWFELGWLAEERGDTASLTTAMSEALRAAAAGDDPERAGLARAYLALAAGAPATAIAGFADVLRQVGPVTGQPSWIVWDAAEAELGAGRAHRAAGQAREAEAALHRARRHLENMVAARPKVFIERRLARTRAELARLLAARRAPRAEIAELARAAADWYRSAGGYEAVLGELAPLAQAD